MSKITSFSLSATPIFAVYHVIYDENLFHEWIMRE